MNAVNFSKCCSSEIFPKVMKISKLDYALIPDETLLAA